MGPRPVRCTHLQSWLGKLMQVHESLASSWYAHRGPALLRMVCGFLCNVRALVGNCLAPMRRCYRVCRYAIKLNPCRCSTE